jgi:hypothetical protein
MLSLRLGAFVLTVFQNKTPAWQVEVVKQAESYYNP